MTFSFSYIIIWGKLPPFRFPFITKQIPFIVSYLILLWTNLSLFEKNDNAISDKRIEKKRDHARLFCGIILNKAKTLYPQLIQLTSLSLSCYSFIFPNRIKPAR